MLTAYFSFQGEPLASISAEGNEVVELSGDLDWLDPDVQCYSPRYGRPIVVSEDAEEWLRCLPGALEGTDLEVELEEPGASAFGAGPQTSRGPQSAGSPAPGPRLAGFLAGLSAGARFGLVLLSLFVLGALVSLASGGIDVGSRSAPRAALSGASARLSPGAWRQLEAGQALGGVSDTAALPAWLDKAQSLCAGGSADAQTRILKDRCRQGLSLVKDGAEMAGCAQTRRGDDVLIMRCLGEQVQGIAAVVHGYVADQAALASSLAPGACRDDVAAGLPQMQRIDARLTHDASSLRATTNEASFANVMSQAQADLQGFVSAEHQAAAREQTLQTACQPAGV